MLDADGRPPWSRKAIALIALVGVIIVAVVVAVMVWTGPKIGVFVAEPTPSQYAEAALRRMDETGYFARGATWEKAKAEARRKVAAARSIDDAIVGLQEAAVVAGGPGSTIVTTTDRSVRERSPADVVRRDKISTITLGDRSRLAPQEDAFYLEDLGMKIGKEAADTCGWLVDLRGARGGSLLATMAALHRLLPQGAVLDSVNRDGERYRVQLVNGQIELHNAVQARGLPGKVLYVPVAVLIGESTSGAGEGVALAQLRRPDTIVMGARTAGQTGLVAQSLLPRQTMLTVTGSYLAAPGQPPATDGVEPVAGGGPSEADAWLRQRCS